MKGGPHCILSQRHMPVLFGLSAKIQGRPNLITLPLVKGGETLTSTLNFIIKHTVIIYYSYGNENNFRN